MNILKKITCFLLLISGFFVQLKAQTSEKPNVIFILTDDQGYGDLACHGNPVVKTPALDQLYQESIRFTNFHVGTTCSPSRSMLMTGQYDKRVGVWHTVAGRSLLDADAVTIANVFRDAGYQTGIFGKWHLGDNYPYRPQDRGFQQSIVFGGGAIGNIQDYWENDYFDDTYFSNGEPVKFEGYCTDIWFEEALQFIDEHKDQPFFCYIPTNAPHTPHFVADKYKQMYSQLSDEAKEKDLDNFYGMITNIDENVGKMLEKLKAWKLERNTIFIFMTDNGTVKNFFYNAGMRGQKGSEYEGGHRVPFFIRWPAGNLVGGRDIDILTGAIDVMPTLVDLCGIESSIAFDGQSLVPLMNGEQKEWEERILFVDRQRVAYPRKWKNTAVMKGSWRLVNKTELYNLENDPGQASNIIKEHPEVANELTDAYDHWWETLEDCVKEDQYIVAGAKEENPTWLTTHDIHGIHSWKHVHVKEGKEAIGFWPIEFAEQGEYTITLRTLPPEKLGGEVIAKKGTDYLKSIVGYRLQQESTYARIKVFDIDVDLPVPQGAEAITFRMYAKAGKTRIQAWLVNDEKQVILSPYYIGITKE